MLNREASFDYDLGSCGVHRLQASEDSRGPLFDLWEEGAGPEDTQSGLRLRDLMFEASFLRNMGPSTQADADKAALLEAAVQRYGTGGVRPIMAALDVAG